MKKIFIVLLLTLSGCAGIETLTPTQSLGTGAVGGAVAIKTVEKVKEVFTPEYKLLVHPFEICSLTDPETITCWLVPCGEDMNCQTNFTRSEWIQSNAKILTVRHSLIANVANFCDKNEDACVDYLGHYEGEKVIIVEDKE